MRRMVEALERRDHPRVRRRLPCSLLIDGCGHRGAVADLSPHGFFVETSAELPRGAGAIIAFSTPEGRRFVLEASVPHHRPVSRSLATLVPHGVGLRVVDPPADYLRWVGGHGEGSPGRP